MKRYFLASFWTLIAFASDFVVVSAQQPYHRPFKSVERVAISPISSTADIRMFRLSLAGDSLGITSLSNFADNRIIDFVLINLEGKIIDSLQFESSQSDAKKMKGYSISEVIFSQNQIYLLTLKGFFSAPLQKSTSATNLTFYPTKGLFQSFQYNHEKLYLSNYNKHYGPFRPAETVYLSSYDVYSNREEPILNFKPQNHFLLNFEFKDYFFVSDSNLFYLHPDRPLLSIYSLDGALIQEVTTQSTWDIVSDSDRGLYNKLSDNDAHKLFSAVSDRFFKGELSMNIRIDKIDTFRFATTTDPGVSAKPDSLRSFRMDIWDYESGILTKIHELEAPIKKRGEILQPDGTKWFDFNNHSGNTFCYRDGKRYQINIEPRASYHDNDQERIDAEKKQSLLNNKFEICLYIGVLDIP